MSGQTTVTAPIGPGLSASAQVFTGVRQVLFDPIAASLQVMKSDGSVVVYDLAVTTTITATASAGVFTFTVSQ